MRNQFSHQTSRITDFQLHGIRNSRNGRLAITSFTVHGQHAMPTRSFWNWLVRKFADNTDGDFDAAEFWNRLQTQQPKAEIEYEIVWDDEGTAMLRAPMEKLLDPMETEASHNRIAHLTSPQADPLFMPSSPGTPRFSLN